jgi:hypothetical protein
MKSIFDECGNAELIERIHKINAHSPAVWGKMNAAQMMAHMQVGINMAFGNIPATRTWIGRCFGTFGKWRTLKVVQLDRHIPTYKQAEITDQRNFEVEKVQLIALVKSALKKGPQALVKYPHPYFGKFKNDEWAQLNWKHFDHHLRQFNSPPAMDQ